MGSVWERLFTGLKSKKRRQQFIVKHQRLEPGRNVGQTWDPYGHGALKFRNFVAELEGMKLFDSDCKDKDQGLAQDRYQSDALGLADEAAASIQAGIERDSGLTCSRIGKITKQMVAVLRKPLKSIEEFGGTRVDKKIREHVDRFSESMNDVEQFCNHLELWGHEERSNLQHLKVAMREVEANMPATTYQKGAHFANLVSKVRSSIDKFTGVENTLHARLAEELRALIQNFEKHKNDFRSDYDKTNRSKKIVGRLRTISKTIFISLTVASVICTVALAVLVSPPIAIAGVGVGLACNVGEALLRLASTYRNHLCREEDVTKKIEAGTTIALQHLKGFQTKIESIRDKCNFLLERAKDSSSILTDVREMVKVIKEVEDDLSVLDKDIKDCKSELDVCKRRVREKMAPDGNARARSSTAQLNNEAT